MYLNQNIYNKQMLKEQFTVLIKTSSHKHLHSSVTFKWEKKENKKKESSKWMKKIYII